MAKKIALPGSTSGIWLKNDLFPRLGIADKISIEMKPRGTDVTNMVATGDADIGVLPVSEILVAAGVDHAGALPSEIQLVQVFAAAVVADSKESAAAKRLIEFLASPRAAEAIRSSGMEPLAASKRVSATLTVANHRDVADRGHHQVRTSMQGEPQASVGRRSDRNKIGKLGKHGQRHGPTPEPSTRSVVDIP